MKVLGRAITILGLGAISLLPVGHASASSHMDAPLIILDPAANTTDVYAFVSETNGVKYLTAALAVYPFEEPSIGPNKYNFDDNVLYEIHVCTGADLKKGKATISYQFTFKTVIKNNETIFQSFVAPIQNVNDDNQNLTQFYTVTKVDHENQHQEVLGKDLTVPPNNQGLVTPDYNQGNSGNSPAKGGVADSTLLDVYTSETIHSLNKGYLVFAGQRDDGFYANIQSIFDLDFSFSGPEKPLDSQAGFNVHTIVINIPVSELGGDQQIVGVYATTSRRATTVLRDARAPKNSGEFVQVGRQGNPAFCELLIAGEDKNLYNETEPTVDKQLFSKYALAPELAKLLGDPANLQTNRTDLESIFIPDVIKTDLSTGPANLAGSSSFNRLSIFGGDTLTSTVQQGFGNGTVPGGWPNGRRFGDDVLGIAVIALLSDLRTNPPTIFQGFNPATFNVGGVIQNDITYNMVFPYAATPHNGRDNEHHTQP
ncbi:MAG: DUF4331 domain-containing protein [Verrucomicrobia bacterium]|nr:DUF4331 domain-containing protein [Verrucomicrobiota bacterium]